MRVVHVTEAPLGGVLSYLLEVVHDQARDDRIEALHVLAPEVDIAALRGIPGSKLDLRPFEHTRGSVLGLLRLAVASVRLLREARPDIVHIHSTFAGVVVRLCAAAVRTEAKIVYCPHGWAFSREGGMRRPLAALERLLAAVTDRIICISDHERQEALRAGIPAEKCVVVENGIRDTEDPADEAAPVWRPDADALKVLFVGRFDRQKGFDIFAEVLRRLGDRAQGVAVGDYIVGATEDRASVPENVRVLGWRPRGETLHLYRGADLLLVPSRWEGFGLVAVEAMRSKLAVFASRVGGLQEVVVDGETGCLFDPIPKDGVGDGAVDAVLDAIAATGRDTLAEYGERGYRRFRERFTASKMNRRLLEVYEALL